MTTETGLQLFATTPKGLELLLVDELRALGATDVAEKLAGVTFRGDLTLAYKACLWSRLANRILLTLAKLEADSPEKLYAAIQHIQWSEHFTPENTFAVHCVSSQSNITHTLFAAQKIKDAIVDQFRDKFGVRPNVDREQPDVSIYVYLHRNIAEISLDLSGDSLHKRGYRLGGGAAPLKENLASAILLRAGWPAISKAGGALMDPMCGSGTLLIEGAMIAGDIAPGLNRDYFGFLGWKKHKEKIWQTLVVEAKARREKGMAHLPTIIGFDRDPVAIKIAFENIERVGLRGHIHVEKRDLSIFAPNANTKPGLVVVNPPYGERLGEMEELQPLYEEFANRLKLGFEGWRAAMFTGNPDLGKQMGLRAQKYYALFNGPIPCKLLLFTIEPQYFIDRSPEADNERRIRAAQKQLVEHNQQGIEMFANRLRKNLKHLKRQAERQGLTSYRVYDADLPEYAFAIDLSEGSAHVVEYQAPKTVNKVKAQQRQQEVLAILPEILDLPAARIFFRIEPRVRKERK